MKRANRSSNAPGTAPAAPAEVLSATVAEDPLGNTGSFARITAPEGGALGAIIVVASVLVAIAATGARLGFGPVGDVLVSLLALALFAGGYAVLVYLGARLGQRLRSRPAAAIVGVVLGGAAVLRAVLGVWIVEPVALGLLGVVGLWGTVVGSAWSARSPEERERRWRTIGFALTATGLGYLVIGYAPNDASAESGVRAGTLASSGLVALGPHGVERHRYGSGTDRRRAAYREGVSVRSAAVNLSAYFPSFTGWRARVHAQYWGFALDRAPLNAELWLPEGAGPFPVVLMMHRVMADEGSELGFGYLGEQLASRGIAAVAIDANYLNGPWVEAADAGVSARAALLLQHVRFLGELSSRDTGLLAGRLDLRRIALLGHSRGGESAAAAAMWASLRRNPEFPEQVIEDAPEIRAVVALAPTDGLYRPAGQSVTLRGVSYLLIRGTRDADAPLEAGNGQFQRTLVDSAAATRKVSIAIVGANHARFNSVGAAQDLPAPLSWLLAREGMLPSEVQRAITSTAVVTFLSSALREIPDTSAAVIEATSAFASRVGAPVTIRSRDGRTMMLAEFDEDVDATTGSAPDVRVQAGGFALWREVRSARSGNSVVQLEWNRTASVDAAPAYGIDVSALKGDRQRALLRGGVLSFAVANAGPAGAFTLEVESRNGVVATRVITVDADAEHNFRTLRWRSPLLEESMVGTAPPTLHTVEISLGEMYAATPGFDAGAVRELRFRFDRSATGRILLDDIGLRAPR